MCVKSISRCLPGSDTHDGYLDAAVLHILQEGEVKKAGEEEEKEQEKLGKLEFTLDYNFTDAQVRPVWRQENMNHLKMRLFDVITHC